MNSRPRVVVAMSGGVDSSVAAALLIRQGYQVIGMMLRLWSDSGCEAHNRCCAPEAMAQARRVAAMLEIPFYALDAQGVFYENVVLTFIDGYAQGITPNPCLACNRSVRWGFLLDHALAMGAQFMATGHYARLEPTPQGCLRLLRATDAQKDQSYVLHMLSQEQLSHSLFPLGEYSKAQVRQMARELGLPVAERADSQDLCFLGETDYGDFLSRHAPQVKSPGPILNRQGESLGEHQGLAFYTIGQRKGLGLAAPRPLYVLEKDVEHNTLIVGRLEELGRQEMLVERINWICGESPTQPLRAQVKIRYRAQDAWGLVEPIANGRARVRFEEGLRDITPGQAAVFYDDQVCLGGGLIQA